MPSFGACSKPWTPCLCRRTRLRRTRTRPLTCTASFTSSNDKRARARASPARCRCRPRRFRSWRDSGRPSRGSRIQKACWAIRSRSVSTLRGCRWGTILLIGADGQLTVKAHLGALANWDWRAHTEVLLRAGGGEGQLIPSREAGKQGNDLLAALGVGSALVVPIVARNETLGILLLASVPRGPCRRGRPVVRARGRSVSAQLGQVLALGRTFAKLAAAEERYRVLLENAIDSIGVLTPDGVILEANKGWQTLMGVPREELVGRNVAEFISPDASQAQRPVHERESTQPGGTVRAMSFQRPDGTVVRVELSQTTVHVGGEPYIFSVGRDVTDRVRLEEQLRQSQKMEAVGSLAAGVAHDFNNLLSVILSYSSLLLEDLIPGDPMRADLEEVKARRRAGGGADGTATRFQPAANPAAEGLGPQSDLGGMEKILRRLLGESLELSLRTSVELGRVYADPGQVEQIVMNLAVKRP